MDKRPSISDDYLKLDYIAEYKDDLEQAIKSYFKEYENFPLLTKNEIVNRKKERLRELEINVIFMLLSSIEAWIKIDYEYRVRKKLKNNLSRELKCIDGNFDKIYKISIEKLCDIYKRHTTSSLFSELKSAFKLRHWNPKIGKKYDFNEVYQLANFTYNFFIKSIDE